MIWLYLFFSVFSLISSRFFFAPLYLFTSLLLKDKKWLSPVVLLFSLLADLFTVRPFGFHGVYYTLFLLIIYLYGQKYNLHNTLFLFIFLLVGSGVYLYLTKIPLHWVSLFFFFLFFEALSFYTREAYKSRIREL